MGELLNKIYTVNESNKMWHISVVITLSLNNVTCNAMTTGALKWSP